MNRLKLFLENLHFQWVLFLPRYQRRFGQRHLILKIGNAFVLFCNCFFVVVCVCFFLLFSLSWVVVGCLVLVLLGVCCSLFLFVVWLEPQTHWTFFSFAFFFFFNLLNPSFFFYFFSLSRSLNIYLYCDEEWEQAKQLYTCVEKAKLARKTVMLDMNDPLAVRIFSLLCPISFLPFDRPFDTWIYFFISSTLR